MFASAFAKSTGSSSTTTGSASTTSTISGSTTATFPAVSWISRMSPPRTRTSGATESNRPSSAATERIPPNAVSW